VSGHFGAEVYEHLGAEVLGHFRHIYLDYIELNYRLIICGVLIQ